MQAHCSAVLLLLHRRRRRHIQSTLFYYYYYLYALIERGAFIRLCLVSSSGHQLLLRNLFASKLTYHQQKQSSAPAKVYVHML